MVDVKEYERAIFMLAEELGVTERIMEELKIAGELIKDNPKYVSLIETPALPMEEKLSLIDGAFSSFDESLLSFLKILVEKRLLRYVPEISRGFVSLYDDSRGILRAEAISAVALSKEQLEKIKERLEKKCEKTVIITNTVSPDMLGGVTLRYSGTQLDGSLKTRLDKLKANLKGAIV